MAALFKTAKDYGGGTSQAKQMQESVHDYITDCECLPINLYGSWNTLILENEDFTSELLLHLQGFGKYVWAMDIVEYVDCPKVRSQLRLTKTISLATAQQWM
jgi:hypothetical protein